MPGGSVPPPRRQAPRSLVGAQASQEQPSRRSIASSHSNPGDNNSAQGHMPFFGEHSPQDIQSLNALIQVEQDGRIRALSALKDEKQKLERSVQQQTQLEEELVSKDSLIEGLSNELRLLKQKKQSADSELAQSTADYMNSQAKWVEQIDGLNDEVLLLKSKLSRCQADLDSANKNLAASKKNSAKEEAAKSKQKGKNTQSDSAQAAATEFSKHQNELFVQELQACRTRLKDEIRELKEMNERLQEDNEHYQYLVIENTVEGKIASSDVQRSDTSSQNDASLETPSPSGAEMQGMSLADDDVLYTLNKAETGTDINSLSSFESSEELQRIVNKQQFELRSLQNHNNALKLSLERLVDRLLDNKTFSKAVEDSVSQISVQRFRNRVASHSHQPSTNYAFSERRNGEPNSSQAQAAILSKMIFNNQYTGSPNRRAFSLGVDNDFQPPVPPSQHGGAQRSDKPRTRVTSGARVSPMTIAFSPSKASASSSKSGPLDNTSPHHADIHPPRRREGITGLQKLRLS